MRRMTNGKSRRSGILPHDPSARAAQLRHDHFGRTHHDRRRRSNDDFRVMMMVPPFGNNTPGIRERSNHANENKNVFHFVSSNPQRGDNPSSVAKGVPMSCAESMHVFFGSGPASMRKP